MKVVLLAGGAGRRISEESDYIPKPMIEIGGMPILWHIMKEYSFYGYNDFIICGGYKQYIIKKWFADYIYYTSDMEFDLKDGSYLAINDHNNEPWTVKVIDTGEKTMTGGRLKRVQEYIGNEMFMLTYGDGVCDVNIRDLVDYHKKHGKIATLTSVIQKQSKGALDIAGDNSVRSFREKHSRDSVSINAGYMVFGPEVFEMIEDDSTVLETEVLSKLAEEGELMSYSHEGFWQCMDNLNEKRQLEKYIQCGSAPWIQW